MKKKYSKPEITTEDVSIAFAQACCEQKSTGLVIGSGNPIICKPTCHITRNDYAVT
jgi:hypothetical protein